MLKSCLVCMLACLFYETGSHVEQADLKHSCLAEDGLELDPPAFTSPKW